MDLIRENGARMTGDVQLGEGVEIGPLAIIHGPCTIGDRVVIGHGAVIGALAEHRERGRFSYDRIVIGADTVIREYVTIHRGLGGSDDAGTRIGTGCYLMNGSHIAHDCRIGNDVTLCARVILAGHTTIQDGATLGLGSSTHQWVTVGACAMVGMGAVVVRDVRVGAKVVGVPARVLGRNDLGLKRLGYSEERMAVLHGQWERLARRRA